MEVGRAFVGSDLVWRTCTPRYGNLRGLLDEAKELELMREYADLIYKAKHF